MRRLITPALAVCAVLCWWVFVASVSPLLSGASNQTAITTCNTAGSCRTALGLGTASTLDVGTSANNIVQLNGSAALPAISGANLTSLPATSYTPAGSSNWAGTDPATDVAGIDRVAAAMWNVPNSLTPPVTAALWFYFLPLGAGNELATTWPDALDGSPSASSSVGLERVASFGQMPHVRIASNTSINAGTGHARPASWTMFALFQVDDAGVAQAIMASAPSNGAAANGHSMQVTAAGDLYYSFGDGAVYSEGETNTSGLFTSRKWHTATVRYTAGDNDCDLWTDGTGRTTQTLATSSTSSTGGTAYQFHIGQLGERTASLRMTGRVIAGLFYTSALSNGDVDTVNTWLKGLGGIP